MPVLTSRQLDHFASEGYVVVKGVLDPVTTLDPVIDEYATVLDSLADALYAQGEITSRYEELEFGDRYIQICVETGRVHSQYFDFSLPFQNVQPDTPFWAGPAVFRAFTDPNLLDVVESLIGPEIYSNPVQHVRIKPPERYLPKNQFGNAILGATQWHQDHGVVTEEADDTQMLTVWFSLQDTPIEKGPLMVAPGSHKSGLLPHCPNYMDNAPQFAGAAQVPEKLFAADRSIPYRLSAATSFSSTSRPSTAPTPTSATRSVGALICATIPPTSPPGASPSLGLSRAAAATRTASCAIRPSGIGCG